MTIREYFNGQRWKFAKTYVKFAPHEYILRQWMSDKNMFDSAVRFIQEHGIRMFYYKAERKYLFLDGWFYWALWSKDDMSDAIINRCKPEDYDIVFMRRGTQAREAEKEAKKKEYVQMKLDLWNGGEE